MAIPEPIDVLFSFDTTGSMYPCLTQVRREVESTVQLLFRDVPGLRIGIITHGDYCDGPKVITLQDFTDDQRKISHFIRNAPSTGGGDAPECYELVLHKARSLAWRSGKSKVLVLIGDDVPHAAHERQNTLNLDWRNELGLLLEAGINVYAVQCLARSRATHFWKEVADKTGGFHLELHQFAAITDLVKAVCFKQHGPQYLADFEQQVEKSGRMNDSTGRCFDIMAGRTPRPVRNTKSTWRHTRAAASARLTGSSTISIDKLEPVHPSRFQVLPVDMNQPIKNFVHDNGLTFNKGRGFYEFIKTVEVQPYKEVVIVDDETGAMFSGDQAREMIGLPKMKTGGNVKISPSVVPGFTVFIQSTSYNRKLLSGTKFLYEMEDWDASTAPPVEEVAPEPAPKHRAVEGKFSYKDITIGSTYCNGSKPGRTVDNITSWRNSFRKLERPEEQRDKIHYSGVGTGESTAKTFASWVRKNS